MPQSNDLYQAYLQILREELIPAMGCTEPIAIAYGASYARDLLGALPDSMDKQERIRAQQNMQYLQ